MDDIRNKTTNNNGLRVESYTLPHTYLINDKYNHNPVMDSTALDKYLCNTIEESIASIDEALAIKDYDNRR